jgi:hypothetical protein
MAVMQGQRRASGLTGGEELASEEAKAMTEPVVDDGEGLTGGPANRPEDVHTTLAPAFRRMRTDWNSQDRDVINQVRAAVDGMIMAKFSDLYDLYVEIFSLVRERDPNKLDEWGQPEWRRGSNGLYIEDWTKVTGREREEWLYRITTSMVRWETISVDLWGEAIFARAQFEEAFSKGYEELENPRATIEDRTARARLRAAEHRYFAVYKSYLSKRGEALVKSAERLGQRIKDLHLS